MSNGQKGSKVKKLLSISALISVLALSACAPGPNAVAPASMPANTYSGMSCQEAKVEHARLTKEVDALSQKQKNAAAGDAIGVFLVLVPVSSLTGNDVQGELATAKGKKLAVEARLGAC